MATKDDCLSFKDKQNILVNNISGDQYRNLNLNHQNHQCFMEQIYPPKSVVSDEKKSKNDAISKLLDLQYSNKLRAKKEPNSWNKSIKHLSTTFLNQNHNSEENNEFKKAKSANNSTLSLHIAAYENAIEADGSKKELLQKSETTGLIKKWKNLNNCVPGLTLVIQNPFEFPRQQDNNQNNRPQIMQFNAAQKLLNPNRASMMASRPPLPPHQGQLYHPYSYHPYAQQYRYPIQQYRYPPQHYQQPPLHYQQPPPQQQNPPHQQQIHPIEIPEIQALEEKETTAHESEGASDNEQSLATEEEKRLAAEYPFIEYPDTQLPYGPETYGPPFPEVLTNDAQGVPNAVVILQSDPIEENQSFQGNILDKYLKKSKEQMRELSRVYLSSKCPAFYDPKPRSLLEYGSFNGGDKRLLFFIFLPILLIDEIEANSSKSAIFLVFWYCIRIIASKKLNTALIAHLKRFIPKIADMFKSSFPEEFEQLKSHIFFIHILLEIEHFGSPYDFTASTFESNNRKLKVYIDVNDTRSLPQTILEKFLFRREIELQIRAKLNDENCTAQFKSVFQKKYSSRRYSVKPSPTDSRHMSDNSILLVQFANEMSFCRVQRVTPQSTYIVKKFVGQNIMDSAFEKINDPVLKIMLDEMRKLLPFGFIASHLGGEEFEIPLSQVLNYCSLTVFKSKSYIFTIDYRGPTK